ncbi:MAG: 50S ribosomal protein L6 [Gemmatimonadetes bacterium]|nr:50S ribosomal protein L6 [Gemmatimonadota bacterium]
MSRIGKQPVELPEGVTVRVEGRTCSIKGPKGSLSLEVHPEIVVEPEENRILVRRSTDQKRLRALHGLTRALLQNSVTGVSTGFAKTLNIVGVGYRAKVEGGALKMNLGFSHPIDYRPPDGVEVACPNTTTVVVSGMDRQKVGQAAADIRSFRPPEPYKGKGIRYQDEQVRRKAGKTAARA